MKLHEARAAHDIVLHRYGAASGIRDLGAIESALARPYCGYYRPIERKAAALVHSLVLNHGFVDGNKRTALGIFLFGSEYGLRFSSIEEANNSVEGLMLAVAEHKISFDEIALWIRARLEKLDERR